MNPRDWKADGVLLYPPVLFEEDEEILYHHCAEKMKLVRDKQALHSEV